MNFIHKKVVSGKLSMILASMILLFMLSCNDDLDVQSDFPFEVEIMPVPKSIAEGEKVTIRCLIKPERKYDGTKYYIRYFQYDGNGKLLLENGIVLKPNDTYNLSNTEKEFWLYYVSNSKVSQTFDVWFFDKRGHERKVSFQFNSKM